MLGTRALQISMNAPVMTEVGNETGATSMEAWRADGWLGASWCCWLLSLLGPCK